MQERSIINGLTAVSLSSIADLYKSLTPFLLLAIMLIVIDSRFGIEAARKRGERIRPSRKWRRAINKLVDYICWITLAGLFSQTFGKILGMPILSVATLIIVYGIELTSCFNNYFEARGISKRVNVFRLFTKTDIGNVLEDIEEKNDKQ